VECYPATELVCPALGTGGGQCRVGEGRGNLSRNAQIIETTGSCGSASAAIAGTNTFAARLIPRRVHPARACAWQRPARPVAPAAVPPRTVAICATASTPVSAAAPALANPRMPDELGLREVGGVRRGAGRRGGRGDARAGARGAAAAPAGGAAAGEERPDQEQTRGQQAEPGAGRVQAKSTQGPWGCTVGERGGRAAGPGLLRLPVNRRRSSRGYRTSPNRG